MSAPEPQNAPQKQPLSQAEQDAIRARQRSRSIVTGLILGAMAILFFAIALAKMMARG